MLREEADPDAQPDAQRIYRIASMYRYGAAQKRTQPRRWNGISRTPKMRFAGSARRRSSGTVKAFQPIPSVQRHCTEAA